MKTTSQFAFIAIAGVLLAACGKTADPNIQSHKPTADSAVTAPMGKHTELPILTVYKDPNCDCCGKWIDHMNQAGFVTEAIVMDDLKPIKEKYGIKPDFRSCHTAVSKDGYVFEGHVPAKLVKQFLSQPRTDAIGLSVPAMVVGSPGMEMGEKFMPYQVLLLKKDGSSEVYAKINQASEQQ